MFVYDPEQNKYTPELVECAMNPTNLKVASRNIGPVIRGVAGLCGRISNKLPSRSAVDNFIDRKLAKSQKQLYPKLLFTQMRIASMGIPT